MRLKKYKVKFNSTKTTFEFTSVGPKGNILKGVEYSKIGVKEGHKNLYNLAFGDKNVITGEIDDSVVTDNQDRDKVLATVANTVIAFTKRHRKAEIFITGSTDPRTRLYQMAISKYFDELSETFDIEGHFDKEWLPYQKGINFEAFLITRKTS